MRQTALQSASPAGVSRRHTQDNLQRMLAVLTAGPSDLSCQHVCRSVLPPPPTQNPNPKPSSLTLNPKVLTLLIPSAGDVRVVFQGRRTWHRCKAGAPLWTDSVSDNTFEFPTARWTRLSRVSVLTPCLFGRVRCMRGSDWVGAWLPILSATMHHKAVRLVWTGCSW